MKQEKDAYEGEWDFDGSCAPNENSSGGLSMVTFSLGCFQWVRRSKGDGLKKGKVVYRVLGRSSNPKKAYEKAREFCAKRNAPISSRLEDIFWEDENERLCGEKN
jgi:hypothetical protein